MSFTSQSLRKVCEMVCPKVCQPRKKKLLLTSAILRYLVGNEKTNKQKTKTKETRQICAYYEPILCHGCDKQNKLKIRVQSMQNSFGSNLWIQRSRTQHTSRTKARVQSGTVDMLNRKKKAS